MAPGSAVAKPRRRTRVGLRLALWALATTVAVDVLVTRRDELTGATSTIGHLQWSWLALAVVAEGASIVAYAGLQRVLLGAGGLAAGIGSLTGITLAGYAIQNSFPAGPAWAAAFGFRQFRRLGADQVLAAWTMVVVAALSGAALALVAAFGLVLTKGQASELDLTEVILVLAVAVVMIVLALRRRELAARGLTAVVRGAISGAQRLTGRPRGDAAEISESWRRRAAAVSPPRRTWVTACVLAVANWLCDCASLALAFFAVRADVPWRGLALAYGAGQLAANLPITPGGLGVVEGSLVVALIFFGGNRASTVGAVLLYRIISFWALVAVGWAAWAVLTLRYRRDAPVPVPVGR